MSRKLTSPSISLKGRRTDFARPEASRRIRHRPTRMCIGCRERIVQDELLRLQLNPKQLLVIVEHTAQRLTGRSVYLCPNVACLDKALRRGSITIKGSKYDKIIVRLEKR